MGASGEIRVQLAEAPAERHVLLASQRLVAKYEHAIREKCAVDFAKRLIVDRSAEVNAGNFRTHH